MYNTVDTGAGFEYSLRITYIKPSELYSLIKGPISQISTCHVMTKVRKSLDQRAANKTLAAGDENFSAHSSLPRIKIQLEVPNA